MRCAALLYSLSLVAILGGCAVFVQDTTRSLADPLNFAQTPQTARIEDQALALTQMGDHLVRWSTIDVGQASDALLSQNELERSIGGMTLVMANLDRSLTAQDAALVDLEQRRGARELSQRQYKHDVAAIGASRARIADALALAAVQAERATVNLQSAVQLGQTGLEEYLIATAQIASGAEATRTRIAPVTPHKATTVTLKTVTPRSGDLR